MVFKNEKIRKEVVINILVIDCESGGLDPKKSAMLQLAMIPIIDGVVKDPFVSHVRPHKGSDIQDGALKVNNINREDLDTFPTIEEFTKSMLEFVDQFDCKFYLRAHNAQFDKDFLYHFMSRQGLHGEYIKRFRPELQCTLEKAKKVFAKERKKPANFKLGTLCEWFGIKLENAHEALSDAEPLIPLWDALEAMEGFKEPKIVLTREEYLAAKYVQINPDGSVFITHHTTTDKNALAAVLSELHNLYSA